MTHLSNDLLIQGSDRFPTSNIKDIKSFLLLANN